MILIVIWIVLAVLFSSIILNTKQGKLFSTYHNLYNPWYGFIFSFNKISRNIELLIIMLIVCNTTNYDTLIHIEDRVNVLPISSFIYQRKRNLTVVILIVICIILIDFMSLFLLYLFGSRNVNYSLIMGEYPIIPAIGLYTFKSLLFLIGAITTVNFLILSLLFVRRPLAIFLCGITIWVLSFFLHFDILPIQWAQNLNHYGVKSQGNVAIWLFLCLLFNAVFYLRNLSRREKWLNFIFLFFIAACCSMFSGCIHLYSDSQPKNEPDIQIPNNIVMIAVSTQCDVCLAEIKAIGAEKAGLRLNKIAFYTIDTHQDVRDFISQNDIDPAINIQTLNEDNFKFIFGGYKFPRAIIYINNKKIVISEGYENLNPIKAYASK